MALEEKSATGGTPELATTTPVHSNEEKQLDASDAGLVPESAAPEDTFPEGGARAWSVAIATAGVSFCTLGYVNTFG